MEKAYALITGGTSGIGLDLAHEFARDNINVIVVGRNKERLESTKQSLSEKYDVDVLIISQDLSETDGAEKLFKRIEDLGISITYLVNNAGVGLDGDFAEHSMEDISEIINVHILNLTKLTNLFIPDLEANKGKILNVSSIAAFQPITNYNIYAASKVFVYNFSLALRGGLREKNISVTVLCPPVTKTNFYDRPKIKGKGRDIRLFEFDSRFVARRGYIGMMSGRAAIFPGISTWIYCTLIVKVIPWRLIM